MDYCEDCSCKVYNGVCTNCHEELYILENQIMQEDEEPYTTVSEEFANKAQEQRNEINNRNSGS